MNCPIEQYEIIRTLFDLHCEKLNQAYLELIVNADDKYYQYDVIEWYHSEIKFQISGEDYDACEYLIEQYYCDNTLQREIEHNILHKNDGYFELYYNLVYRMFYDIQEIFRNNYFKDNELPRRKQRGIISPLKEG